MEWATALKLFNYGLHRFALFHPVGRSTGEDSPARYCVDRCSPRKLA